VGQSIIEKKRKNSNYRVDKYIQCCGNCVFLKESEGGHTTRPYLSCTNKKNYPGGYYAFIVDFLGICDFVKIKKGTNGNL